MLERLKAVVVVVPVVVLLSAGAAQAHRGAPPPPPPPPQPTLTGEHFRSVNNPDFLGGTGSAQVTTSCNADGTGTIWFRVTGTATGPYPGTFTESGVVRLGDPVKTPPTGSFPAVYSVVAFAAAFQIQSGTTTITGAKWRGDVGS